MDSLIQYMIDCSIQKIRIQTLIYPNGRADCSITVFVTDVCPIRVVQKVSYFSERIYLAHRCSDNQNPSFVHNLRYKLIMYFLEGVVHI